MSQYGKIPKNSKISLNFPIQKPKFKFAIFITVKKNSNFTQNNKQQQIYFHCQFLNYSQ